MREDRNQSLPFDLWPENDRLLWAKRYGSATTYSPFTKKALSKTTIRSFRYAYALLLYDLHQHQNKRLALPLEERLTPGIMAAFVERIRASCRETTVSIALQRIFFVCRTLAPQGDWQWLLRIQKRIARRARRLQHRYVAADEIFPIGYRLMDKALVQSGQNGISLTEAAMFRDGLMISVLVETVMRRAALAGLEIDNHLFKIGDHWCISVPGDLVKTRKAEYRELSEKLSSYVDLYLERFRPRFPNSDNHLGIWPYLDRPMTDKMVRRYILKHTKADLGFGVTPHRFRSAAVNLISKVDPKNMRVAKDLLGHATMQTTENHYLDKANSRLAGRRLEEVLRSARP